MEEAHVRLVCPECSKNWQTNPGELPASTENYHCPNCRATRRTSEFMRTEHDLRTLQQLS